MSVFGPNQVQELILGNAVASETSVADFIADASDKEIKVLSVDGGAPASGKDFKVYQKTSGDAAKGLNYEFSDTVKVGKVKEITVKEYSAEVQKSVAVTGFDGNVKANTTYAVEIRLIEEGGLSPENFAVITGYHVTGSNVTGVSASDIRDGIVASLENNLKLRGAGEFTITTPDTSETDIVITGQPQSVVAGKKIGSPIYFDVTGKVFENASIYHDNLGLLETEVLQGFNPGNGTGKYAVNLEWFTKGYKYEVYREASYPANFDTPYYASAGSTYNTIHIKYFDDRESPTVENQNKVLTILVERTDLASNAVTNAVLADLRTALGSDIVPSDLAVA